MNIAPSNNFSTLFVFLLLYAVSTRSGMHFVSTFNVGYYFISMIIKNHIKLQFTWRIIKIGQYVSINYEEIMRIFVLKNQNVLLLLLILLLLYLHFVLLHYHLLFLFRLLAVHLLPLLFLLLLISSSSSILLSINH